MLFVEEMIDAAKAKQLAFDFRDKIEEGIVILVTQFEDKCSYFVGVTKNYVATGYKAGDIIKKSMQLLMVAVVESRILLKVAAQLMIRFPTSRENLKISFNF